MPVGRSGGEPIQSVNKNQYTTDHVLILKKLRYFYATTFYDYLRCSSFNFINSINEKF